MCDYAIQTIVCKNTNVKQQVLIYSIHAHSINVHDMYVCMPVLYRVY